jgi:hypothetical protein
MYSIILHLVSICFAIEIIQLYKTARFSSIKNPPIIFPEEGDIDPNKSYNTVNMGKTNNNKKTFTSNNLKFEKTNKHKR